MRTPWRRDLLALAVLVTALLAAAGCSLFKPRSAQKPVTPSVACLDLVTTANIVTNIQAQYGKAGGSTCYAAGIDTGFVFHPIPPTPPRRFRRRRT